MTAAGFITAIGFLTDGLSLVNFIDSQIPGKDSGGTSLKIKAGLADPGNDEDSLGGSINGAYSWGQANEFLGLSGGCQIDPAGTCDLMISQSVASQRGEYIGVSNNDDATCIAWISVVQYDGTVGGAWTGDIGRYCDQRFYYSKEKAGTYKDTGEDYIPSCTWLDEDGSNDIVNAALKFSLGAYGVDVTSIGTKEVVCASTLWGGDSGPIAEKPAKRSIPERPTWMLEHLIVSTWTSQTAAELCDSAMSWGPDFVGSDGQFCDMATKTLTPLCSSETIGSSGCVDFDEEAVSVVKRTSVARRAAKVTHKSYKKIQKWGV